MKRQKSFIFISLKSTVYLIWILILFATITQAQNLLLNSSFEEKDARGMPANWYSSSNGGSLATWDDYAYNGNGAGKVIKARDGISNVSALAQRTSVQPNTKYTLSGFAFAQGFKGGIAALFAYEYDEDLNFLGVTARAHVPETYEREYCPISVDFKTRNNTRYLEVRFEIYEKSAVGEAWVDDVYLGQYKEAPSEIINLTAEKLADDSVMLSWESTDAQRYLIYLGSNPEFVLSDGYFLGESTVPSWQDKSVYEVPTPDHSVLKNVVPNRYYAIVATDEALGMSSPVYSQRITCNDEQRAIGWTVGSRKVMRDEWPSYITPAPIKISAARNEYEPFQVVIRSFNEEITDLTVTVSDLVGSNSRIGKYDIEIKVPHYIWLDNPENSFYKPGWYPDALIPINALNLSVPVDKNVPIWFTVYIPSDAKPGLYTGSVTLISRGVVLDTLPIELEVWPFELPKENHQETAFGLWLNQVAPAHGFSQSDPNFTPIAWNYYWFLMKHRVNPRELPISPFSDEAIELFKDPRITSFVIPWPGRTGDPQFDQRIQRYREEGLLSKGYIYAMDEPSPAHYPAVYKLGQDVHSYGRDLRMLMTVEPTKELYGEIDIWCPVLWKFDPESAKERQNLGESIWWYTCVGPKNTLPTYFIDSEAVGHRVLSWLQVKYDVEGTLYWSTTVFQKWSGSRYVPRDVWIDPVAFPNTHGDGYLLYPGTKYGIDGPIGTIRLEMIREGNEDLEYFWLLKDAAQKYGLTETEIEEIVNEIIEPVATDLTDWQREPELLYEQREKLAEKIICFQSKL